MPTPQIITVRVTPALFSLGKEFHQCAEEQTTAGLAVVETPTEEIGVDIDGLALRWGSAAAPPGYAAQIGTEELAMIVSAGSPMREISLAELHEIYQGRLSEKDGAEIRPWAYAGAEDVQEVFQLVLLAGAGVPARVASTVPNPAAMLEAVASDSGAIGFVPARWVNGDVRVLTITGLPADRLRQPILAVSESEPEDPERAWLLCLQALLE